MFLSTRRPPAFIPSYQGRQKQFKNSLKMLSFLTLFTLPADTVSSTTAYIGEIFTDASSLVYLAIGVPLAFYVIKKVMGLLPRR